MIRNVAYLLLFIATILLIYGMWTGKDDDK